MKKVFKVFGIEGRSVIGVKVEGLELTLEVVAGKHPHVHDVVWLIAHYLRDEWERAAAYKRKNPYRPNHWDGTSGCVDYIIEWVERVGRDFAKPRRKHVLHVSCAEKVSRIQCFLPDLVEVFKYAGWVDEHLDAAVGEEPEVRETDALPTEREKLEELGFIFPEGCEWDSWNVDFEMPI